jgi:hypothetical protein
MSGVIHPLPQYALMAWCLAKAQGQLYLIFSFLGSTAQLRPWPPPQNPSEFLEGFSKIFFFTGLLAPHCAVFSSLPPLLPP